MLSYAAGGRNICLESVSPPTCENDHCSRYGQDQNALYHVTWMGDWLASSIESDALVGVVSLSQSSKYSKVMARTKLLSYGSECQIRIAKKPEQFPIYKLAMPDDVDGRQRLQKEHDVLSSLQAYDLSPRIDRRTLSDDLGVFGYSMEKLERVSMREMLHRFEELREVVARLHKLSIVHGDLSLSNFMKTANGRLIMIDFGQSGTIGCTRRPWQIGRRGEEVFAPEIDVKRLEEIRKRLIVAIEKGDIDDV